MKNDTDPLELAKEDVPQEKYEKLSKDEIQKNLLGNGNFPLTEALTARERDSVNPDSKPERFALGIGFVTWDLVLTTVCDPRSWRHF